MARGLPLIILALFAFSPTALRAQMGASDPASVGLSAVGSVSETHGTSTYRIPLVVPPGPDGHTPKLALVYQSKSSKGPAGPFGFGWKLEGLSAIERDRKFGPPYDLTQPLGSAFEYRHDFVLDGQDLIFDSSAGGRDRYRTQRDDGRLIEYIPSSNTWEIRDRQGRLFVYGTSASSRIDNDKNGETFSWLLQQVDDAHGNRITYWYQFTGGVARLTNVFWGDGTAQNRRINIYPSGYVGAVRPDQPISYSAGFRQKLDHRITRIDLYVVKSGASKHATHYDLDYDQGPASGRSRLVSVTRGSSDWAGKQAAHSFTYSESTPGFDATASNYIANAPGVEPGFMDLIVVAPIGIYGPIYGEILIPGSATDLKQLSDLDSDGTRDVFKTVDSPSRAERWPGDGNEYLNAPETWSSQHVAYLDATLTLDAWFSPSTNTYVEKDTLDMDGDGFPDGVSSLADPWDVYLGSATGMSSTSTAWPGSPIDLRIVDQQVGSLDLRTTRDLLDLTGDGLPDRIDSSGGSAWTVVPNGGISGGQGSWLSSLSWPDPAASWIVFTTGAGDDTALLQDINSDGLLDRVYHNGTSWRVAFNFGGGFDTSTEQNLLNAPASLSLASGSCKTSHLIDINGDGFVDHVSTSGSPPQWTVKYGTGEGFQATGVDWTPTWSGGGTDPRSCVIDHERPNGNSTLQDVDSDGLVDWILALDEVYLSLGPQSGLLDSATNPLAGVTFFDYGTSAMPSATCGSSLNPDLPYVRPVVSQMEIQDDLGNSIIDEYCFADAGYDRSEREFRGYGTVTRTQYEAEQPSTEILREYVIDPALDRACGREIDREVVTDLFSSQILRRRELDYLLVSGPTALPNRWDACLLTEVRTEDVEGDESGRKMSRTTIAYGATPEDQLPQEILEYGEVDPLNPTTDLGDDSRRTVLTYASPASTDRHLIASPSEVQITDLAAITTVSHERRYYDGLPLGQVSEGNVTKVEKLKESSPPAWVATTMQYDSYGNEFLTTGPPTLDDPNGHQVQIWYESDFHTFPIQITRGSDTSVGVSDQFSYLDADCAQGLAPPAGLGLPCMVTRPGNVADRFGYDTLAHLTRVERASGRVETIDYCPTGYSICTEDVITATLTADASTTLTVKTFLDGLGRTYREEQPGDSSKTVVISRTFDDRGRIATETIPHFSTNLSPLARVASYDALGRIASVLSEDGTTIRTWSYAPWAVVEEVFFGPITPSNRRSYTLRIRDGRRRLNTVYNYENAVSLGTPLVVDAFYDELDRLVEVRDPIANNPSWCAGLAPNCSVQDHKTFITYDLLGRRTELLDPDSGSWTYTYDDAGLLLTERDGAGRGSDYEYDELQRVSKRLMVPLGSGSEDAGFSYGANPFISSYGRLETVSALSSGITTYQFLYDTAGRLSQEMQTTPGYAGSLTSSFTYDHLDRIDQRTFPDGATWDHNYDSLWLIEVRESGGYFNRPIIRTATYDASGRPTFYSIGDRNDQTGTSVLTLSYGYDSNTARLTQILADPTADTDMTLDYTLDGLGRLTDQTIDGQSRSFQYDGLSRITQAVGPWEGGSQLETWNYSYDPLGNLFSQTSTGNYTRSWEYDDSNAPRFLTEFVENASTETMVPEPGGNPATRNGSEQFIWNAQNRLHKTTANDSTNHYDVFDRRVRQEITGANATSLIYAGDDFEYDTTQDVSIKYLIVGGQRIASLSFPDPFGAFSWPSWLRPWLPLGGQIVIALAIGLALLGIAGIAVQGFGVRPPAWLSAPAAGLLAVSLVTLTLPTRAWAGSLPHGNHNERLLAYITDHLGSVRGVVNLLGVVVEERDYTPFGMTVNHTGTFDLRHRFTGQAEDDAAGFYDYGARRYDPRWGRFLSPDSLIQSFDSQGLNRYAYVSNTPTSLVDPTGNVGGCFAVVLVTSCFGGGFTGFSHSAAGIRAGIDAAITRLIAAFLAGLGLGDGGGADPGDGGGSVDLTDQEESQGASNEPTARLESGDRFEYPEGVRRALEDIFGEDSTVGIEIIYLPWYVRLHGISGGSVTRPERIYTDLTPEEFFDDEFHTLHEHYHVAQQWRTGELTRRRYVWEVLKKGRNNKFEREANVFARKNEGILRRMLGR